MPAPPVPPQPSALSLRFLVDDLSGAQVVGSRLNNLLAALAEKRPMRPEHRTFLRDQGALALLELIDGTVSEAAYAARAQLERQARQEAAHQREEAMAAARRLEAALAEQREAALWARLKKEDEARQAARRRHESSPEFIARQKTRQQARALLDKYGVSQHVEPEVLQRLLSILRQLAAGDRLSAEDADWLQGQVRQHRRDDWAGVLRAYHRVEADTCLKAFSQHGDPWQAINASGHLRKCGAPQEALDLLVSISPQRLEPEKLRSAMLTTQGGALRDLEHFAEAQQAGEAAHALLPQDYRPCTLLGAVHLQQGDYGRGHDWYRKAEERGAPAAGHDAEIRSLLRRMPEAQRRAAVDGLLGIDPARYRWLAPRS